VIYDRASMPPLGDTIEAPPVDRSTPAIVSYGPPEDDPTTQATLAERPTLTRMRVFRLVPQRRRRFITWHDADGRAMGRWTWESYRPRLEGPLD
jgi:hypothetical protein